MSPDGRAEGVFEASGGVSWLWCLKGLPESSGSAVWGLQGRAAGSQGQSLVERHVGDNTFVLNNKIDNSGVIIDIKTHLKIYCLPCVCI